VEEHKLPPRPDGPGIDLIRQRGERAGYEDVAYEADGASWAVAASGAIGRVL
jgi:hypothetical protein